MHWVIFMFNDKEPLMFINNIQPQINESNKQKVYDSRNPKSNKDEDFSKAFDSFENRKLENIIQMYHKGKPVLCTIVLSDSEIVGIPISKEKNIIKIQLSENEIREVKQNNIKEINIIKF